NYTADRPVQPMRYPKIDVAGLVMLFFDVSANHRFERCDARRRLREQPRRLIDGQAMVILEEDVHGYARRRVFEPAGSRSVQLAANVLQRFLQDAVVEWRRFLGGFRGRFFRLRRRHPRLALNNVALPPPGQILEPLGIREFDLVARCRLHTPNIGFFHVRVAMNIGPAWPPVAGGRELQRHWRFVVWQFDDVLKAPLSKKSLSPADRPVVVL